MLIRKYRARNLKEALRQVKADLGESAAILSSRTIPCGLFGSQLEVTATLPPMQKPGGYAKTGRSAAPGGTVVQTAEPPPAPPPPKRPGVELEQVVRFLSPLRQEIRAVHKEIRALAGERAASDGLTMESALEEIRDLRKMIEAMKAEAQQAKHQPVVRPSEVVADAIVADEAPEPSPQGEVLERLGEKLLSSGMRSSLAQQVLEAVAGDLPDDPEQARFCAEPLAAQVIGEGLTCVPPLEQSEGPRVVAFIGPTGVGKTTTLAKVATRAALIQQRRVGVIGCDSERIGAGPTLQSLAEMIGVPCRMATDADELGQAIRELGECELILVDTSGVSARDTEAMEELARLLGDTAVEPCLLLNADMRSLELDSNLVGFAATRPRFVVFTKVDQAVELGVLYDGAVSSGLPVMYLTNGRRIPEDIEDATPERIASMVLGFQYN
jgi:flagellar biosynthesis protein FlhF